MVTEEQIDSLRTREQKYRRRRYNDMYISREVIMSEAIRKLTGKTIWVYLIFLSKRVMKRFEGSKEKRSGKGKYFIENNGQIVFTYREALEKYGITRPAFAKAIDQLVKSGFIDITKTGSGLHRDISLYAISDRWAKYGTDEFVFMERPKRSQHYGFQRGCKKKMSTAQNVTC